MIAPGADPSLLEGVARLLSDRTGLVFPRTRRRDMEQGIRRAMAKVDMAEPRAWLDRIATDPALLDDLVAGLTVGETYFFREPEHFAFIREQAVPEIMRVRAPGHVLRAWSAGCATGEEAYSLAILFEEMGMADRARVLATDLSRNSLMRAREGKYGDWSLRRGATRLIGPYLRRSGSRFEVVERLRRKVTFAYLNLAEDVYPSSGTETRELDLVLCRNVMIYLGAEAIGAIARRFYETLAPGGYLITGPSDPLLGHFAPFESTMTKAGLIYRRPRAGEAALPTPYPAAGAPAPPMPRSDVAAAPVPAAIASSPRSVEPVRRAHSRGKPDGALASTVRHIRAMADQGESQPAMSAAATAVRRDPGSLEVRFLQAVLLMSLGRHNEAERALRQILFLDRSLAVVHFALGATLRQTGDVTGARRAFANAHAIAASHPPDSVLAFSEGERAGRLAEAAKAQLDALAPVAEGPS